MSIPVKAILFQSRPVTPMPRAPNQPMAGRLTASLRISLAAGLLLLAGTAAAIDTLTFDIRRIDGSSDSGQPWSAQGIQLQLLLGVADPAGAELTIDRLVLPAPIGTLRGVRLRCAALGLQATEYRCARTRAQVRESMLDDHVFAADISYAPQTGVIRFSSADVPLLGQRVTVTGEWTEIGWSARLNAAGLDAQALYAGLARYSDALPGAEVSAGSVSVTATASAVDAAGLTLSATMAVENLGVSNESGTLASDGLAARVQIDLAANDAAAGYAYRLSFTADGGEAYFEPAYFNFAAPVTLQADGTIDADATRISVEQLSYRHTGALSAHASAQLSRDEALAIDHASVTIESLSFPAAYRTYVQGFLVGTPLAKLQTSGSMRGKLEIRDGSPSAVDMSLAALNADDVEQRLAIYGVDGDVHWRSDSAAAAPQSHLRWEGGFIYATGYGGGALTLELGGDDIALIGTARVPVLDGAFVFDTFAARGLESDRAELDLEARLEPIGLRRLTAALGWPAFPGTLSGELPSLSLRDGVITVGGSLVARVFDGTVSISRLRIEQPFAANRRAFADVVLDNLDFGLITEVFSLGRIAGRLDGRIEGLQTVKNQPVAFDARFYTPPDDNTRHRISRRAINNLSEIAGGGTALLASGFLKFFEDFGYSSIGISCRLQGDVCEMSGIKPAVDGYYIVQGKGLPRIDVIGHAREVNWRRLVAQIQEALKSGDATTRPPSEK